VLVCACAQNERERDRQTETERERKMYCVVLCLSDDSWVSSALGVIRELLDIDTIRELIG